METALDKDRIAGCAARSAQDVYPWGPEMLSIPCVTRLEQASLVGNAAKLISHGAPSAVADDVDSLLGWDMTNSRQRAEFELEHRASPLRLRRLLPDGRISEVDPNLLVKCDP